MKKASEEQKAEWDTAYQRLCEASDFATTIEEMQSEGIQAPVAFLFLDEKGLVHLVHGVEVVISKGKRTLLGFLDKVQKPEATKVIVLPEDWAARRTTYPVTKTAAKGLAQGKACDEGQKKVQNHCALPLHATQVENFLVHP